MNYCRILNYLQSIILTVKLLNDLKNIKRSKNIHIQFIRIYYCLKDEKLI